MKICFITNSYPTLSHFGGIAVYTRTAALALSQRGHEVHVLVARPDGSSDSLDHAVSIHLRPVKWLPVLGKWLVGLGESFCTAWWLLQLQRKYHFDLVEFPNWEGIGLVSALFRVAPVVVRLHTSTADSIAVAKRQPKRGERFLMWAEKMSAKFALDVVTHTEAHRDNLQRALNLENVEVIPHGIEIPPAVCPEKALSILIVGPLNARKGADALLAAIPLVLEKNPDAQFHLAGPGEGDPKAQRFRAEHPGISAQQVQFMGFVSNEKLAELYADCAVYASASIYESFGLTFIEAMACGKPVVGCAVSAMIEVIDHEKTGLLTPPGDAAAFAEALLRLLNDPGLRQQMGSAGRQVAIGQYSAGKMAQAMECYYERVIA